MLDVQAVQVRAAELSRHDISLVVHPSRQEATRGALSVLALASLRYPPFTLETSFDCGRDRGLRAQLRRVGRVRLAAAAARAFASAHARLGDGQRRLFAAREPRAPRGVLDGRSAAARRIGVACAGVLAAAAVDDSIAPSATLLRPLYMPVAATTSSPVRMASAKLSRTAISRARGKAYLNINAADSLAW
jgi:hypothetical protein